MSNENPLLTFQGLPPFSQIKPEHVEPAIDQILNDNRQQLDALLESGNNPDWQNLVEPIEDMMDRLSAAWSPVSHMNSVVNSDALRDAYNACLEKLSEYYTELGQNENLFKAYQSLASSPAFAQLDEAQNKVIQNEMRDFRLSGIDLSAEKKQRYREIMQQLSKLTSKFGENVLDATQAWSKLITDEQMLDGLPDTSVALLKQQAENENKSGWLLNLEFPSYYPVITYADNRELRREMYEAYVTRASDEGPNAGQWDNSPVMNEILALRHEVAQLLGFNNYAERSIETKMAASTDQVVQFLQELADKSLPAAKLELEQIRAYAKKKYGVDEPEAWDIPYYSEKLRQSEYNISQEEVKPYFPAQQVIDGMFAVVGKLYGISIIEKSGIDTWHEDVQFFEIKDNNGETRGQFYLDLYARANKRGGAWMDECISRKKRDGEVQTPVAYLTCNFTPPIGDNPALLTHGEVETLFHEFGHGLHHMLTRIDYTSVSGISGVAWDAVELPSQFMENWCWEREALDLFAAHYQTGEKIPEDLYQRMKAAKNFQSAMQMVRQLEFSLFDFRLHREYDPDKGAQVYELLDDVRQQVSVLQPPSFNRFPHSFSHIFAGGYAAGYYSYKWAEVLSADAFSAFEESHIFDQQTGQRFLQAILEKGGSREPMELFVDFRGREPTIDALLRHCGLAA